MIKMKTKECGVFENIVVENGAGGHEEFCLEGCLIKGMWYDYRIH